MRNRFDVSWIGASVASISTVLAGALSFAGAPPADPTAPMVMFTADRWHWIVALWIAAFLGALHAFYTLHRAKGKAEAALSVAQSALEQQMHDQVLSDLMSDQWETGIVDLLNQPPTPGSPQSLKDWQDRVRRWEQLTIKIMEDHKCTKQDIRSVHIIGLAPYIQGLHPEPGTCHATSMFVAQLGRVGDIAHKYGD